MTMKCARCLPVFAMIMLSACSTAPAVRTVSPGEPVEPSAGFDENDMRSCVSDIAMKLQRVAAKRCRVVPGRRLPVEIRPFACEGVSPDQVSIGKLLASRLEEGLTDGGMFVVVCPDGTDQSAKDLGGQISGEGSLALTYIMVRTFSTSAAGSRRFKNTMT